MPRWASRLLLEVVAVRVERLNDISESDAQAEGIEKIAGGWRNYDSIHGDDHHKFWLGSAVNSFDSLWESIHGPGSWDTNPWVWVVEFQRINAIQPR